MTCDLANVSVYRKGKVEVSLLSLATYISTENMLPNKGGITIASSLPNTLMTQAYKKDDILVSNIRPYFKKIWKAKYDGGCSNDVLVLTAKNGTDPDFLYYVLANDAFFDYSMAMSKGTKMPRGDKQSIMKYQLPLIELKMQKKIARFLRSIDEKIEVNRKINDNLMQQGTSLFNEYLVKFDDVPSNWKVSSLDRIADYINGLAMQKYPPKDNEEGLPVLKIAELKQGCCDSNSDRCTSQLDEDYIINDGDVIFSWSASLVVDLWCGGKAGLNQHLFNVKSNIYDKWFYFWWTKYHLNEFIHEASSKATTMGHIKRDNLSKAKVLIPSKNDYEAIGRLLKPITDSIVNVKLENKRLSALRDSLLPKLMSGEIDVDSIEL